MERQTNERNEQQSVSSLTLKEIISGREENTLFGNNSQTEWVMLYFSVI